VPAVLHCAQVPGQTESFMQHMQLGIMEAAQDPSALVIFSGGQTRKDAGPRSEAASYWSVAEAAGWFGKPEVRSRAITEVRPPRPRLSIYPPG
jgi:hypothetical protein